MTPDEIKAHALLIEKAVRQWFREHPKVDAVRVKELADYLVQKKAIKPRAAPAIALDRILNRLFQLDMLHLVPSVRTLGITCFFARNENAEAPKKETALQAALRKYRPKEL